MEERYTALRRSEYKRDFTKFSIVMGIFIIVYSLYRMDFWMAAIGAVIIYVVIYSKDVVVDKNGVTTHYHAIFYNKSRTYPFSEFTELRVQKTGVPETIVGFVRNGMNTPCLFTDSDAKGVIRLAKECNPRLYVREMPPRGQRGL